MLIAIEGERSAAVVASLKGSANGSWNLSAEPEVETLAAFSAPVDSVRQIAGIAATETSILLATQKM